MLTEIFTDWNGSYRRGKEERRRIDHLIDRAGGIVQYMTGPRYTPRNEPPKEVKEHDDRREAGDS